LLPSTFRFPFPIDLVKPQRFAKASSCARAGPEEGMTSMSIYQKNFMLNWRKQLWVLVFMAGLSCLGQTVQPPLGATPKQSGTTFRLWAPFVDSVVVKVNDREPVRMSKEDAHKQTIRCGWPKYPGPKSVTTTSI
jgi:hypothetical protein